MADRRASTPASKATKATPASATATLTASSAASSSYVDDLMRGGVDLLDVSRVRSRANTLSGMKASARAGAQGEVLSASVAPPPSTPTPMTTTRSRGEASGEDLEAFFGSTTKAVKPPAMGTATSGGVKGRGDDAFGEFASFASSSSLSAAAAMGTATPRAKTPATKSASSKDGLDDFFGGLGASSQAQGRDMSHGVNAATARVPSAGSDLFDLLSGSSTPTASTSVADLADFASRSQSPGAASSAQQSHKVASSNVTRAHVPLMSHASDASLIDGLDEILGDMSIGEAPPPKCSTPAAREVQVPSSAPPSQRSASPPRAPIQAPAPTPTPTPAGANAHARSASFNDADADMNEFFGHKTSNARAKVVEVGASMKAGVTRLFKAAVKTTEKFTAEVSGKTQGSTKPAPPQSPPRKQTASKPAPKVVEPKRASTTPAAAPTPQPSHVPVPKPAPKVEPKPAPKPEPVSNASSVEDLDDFFSAGSSSAVKAAKPANKASTAATVDPIEAMFTVKHASTTRVTTNVPASGVVDDLFGTMDSTSRTTTKSASAAFAYNPEETEEVDPNEPPERAALRKARHERNRARIETALKEKRAREQTIRSEQNERQMLKDLIGADIDEWAKKNQNNIRTLLANLAEVLWDGHRYVNPTMGSLMSPNGVKKSYHKALVIIHPDKVSQSGGDMSQRFIADKVFDIVKNAYKEFEAKELR